MTTERNGLDSLMVRILIALCGFLAGTSVTAGLVYTRVAAAETHIQAIEEWRVDEMKAALSRTERISRLEGQGRADEQWRDSISSSIEEIKERLDTIAKRLPGGR